MWTTVELYTALWFSFSPGFWFRVTDVIRCYTMRQLFIRQSHYRKVFYSNPTNYVGRTFKKIPDYLHDRIQVICRENEQHFTGKQHSR